MSKEATVEVIQDSNQEVVKYRSVHELAELEGNRGIDILNKRIEALLQLRRGSIAQTFPHDWTLFKGEAGVYGYLGDSGCERVKKLWGIMPYNHSDYTSEDLGEGNTLYMIQCDGVCHLTGDKVDRIIGGRDTASMEMGNDVPAGKLRLDTMKAARSNADGGVVRDLAGLANVPIEELNKVFGRQLNDLSGFGLGKGFGSQADRHGAAGSKADYGPAPKCPKCASEMRLFDKDPASPYWGCPAYRTCGQKTIPAKKIEQSRETQPHSDVSKTTEEKPLKVGEYKNQLFELIKQLPTSEERQAYKKQVLEAKTVEDLAKLQEQMNGAIGREPGSEG